MPSSKTCPTCGRPLVHDGKRWWAPYWCSWERRRVLLTEAQSIPLTQRLVARRRR